MKNRILRIAIIVLIVGGALYLSGGWEKLLRTPTVRAFGDIIVDFHALPGTPIFSLNNMFPGQSESRVIDVSNNGSVARLVAVKGFRTGGTDLDPKIETQLDFVIKDGSTIKYGPVKMSDFFSASSSSEDGIMLDLLQPNDDRTYTFIVEFPASSGNDFQGQSVMADFTFGAIVSDNLVINEVYSHIEHPKCLELVSVPEKNFRECLRWAGSEFFFNKNKADWIKYQWLEVYNPSDEDINLKNWTVTDNSGKVTKINKNKKVKAGGFALISRDDSMWKYWNPDKQATQIEFREKIGNGLDPSGDRLILKNNLGEVIDSVSWGNDMSVFSPSVDSVSARHSIERLAPGFDTNAASDWIDRNLPTPGN